MFRYMWNCQACKNSCSFSEFSPNSKCKFQLQPPTTNLVNSQKYLKQFEKKIVPTKKSNQDKTHIKVLIVYCTILLPVTIKSDSGQNSLFLRCFYCVHINIWSQSAIGVKYICLEVFGQSGKSSMR